MPPGRRKSPNTTKKVRPTISLQMVAFISELIEVGAYGNTESEVAAYLIQRGLDDLLRAGVLKPTTKTTGSE